MTKILQIKTSIFLNQGWSSRLSDELVEALKTKFDAPEVVIRDLAQNPIPHLDASGFLAFLEKPESRSPGQQALVAASDKLVEELKSSDIVVIGLPLYNLDIPSTLKSWFDQISRAGVTFSFTEQGVKGLLSDRKVYLVATRGGIYSGTPLDTQSAFVRNFFGLIGITDLEFIYAEGMNMGDDPQAAGLASARAHIARIGG